MDFFPKSLTLYFIETAFVNSVFVEIPLNYPIGFVDIDIDQAYSRAY
jgi:hypothetical protein